jgi:hypothetical protein
MNDDAFAGFRRVVARRQILAVLDELLDKLSVATPWDDLAVAALSRARRTIYGAILDEEDEAEDEDEDLAVNPNDNKARPIVDPAPKGQ